MNTLPFVRLAGTKRKASSAFTLLELLVVISIIALLAGILLPVVGSVMENARKVEAKNTVVQIVSAVKSFQTDYGVYPVMPGTTQSNPPTDTTYTEDTNCNLFHVLRADGSGTDAVASSPNTRRVVYFEGKDVKTPNKPKSGFATQAATTTIGTQSFNIPVGTLVDPWGVGYMVRYDTGYDSAVMIPETDGNTPSTSADSTSATTAGTTTGVVRSGVIAWSYGKDGQAGLGGNFGTSPGYTYGDDVVSWQ